MFVRWNFTVCWATQNSFAICSFDRPRASAPRIAISRSVSPALSRRSTRPDAVAPRLRTRCPPPPLAACPAGRSGRRSSSRRRTRPCGARSRSGPRWSTPTASRPSPPGGACGSRRGTPARPCAASAGRAAPGRGSCGRRAGAPGPVLRLPDDLESTVFLERPLDPVEDEAVIVGDYHAHGASVAPGGGDAS